MKTFLAFLIIVIIFASTSSYSRQSEEKAQRFQTWLKKLSIAAEQTHCDYIAVFIKRMEENVYRFQDALEEHPWGIQVSLLGGPVQPFFLTKKNDEAAAAFIDVYNGMHRDIVDDLRVVVAEKTRMTSDKFERWLASWKAIKDIVSIIVLAFTQTELKPFVKVAFAIVEMFVMTMVSLVEDFVAVDDPLATVESFILVIAQIVMSQM